jgi:plastocyanin
VHTIVIDGMRFIPQTVEVKPGDTVVWRNKDPFPHTVAAVAGPGLASPVIAAGASWRFKADKPGAYPYLCTLHRTMTATLVVK